MLDLISMEWFKSTVFQTVAKNHLHAEHAPFEKTDLKSVTLLNLPALAGSGLVIFIVWLCLEILLQFDCVYLFSLYW